MNGKTLAGIAITIVAILVGQFVVGLMGVTLGSEVTFVIVGIGLLALIGNAIYVNEFKAKRADRDDQRNESDEQKSR